MAKLSLKAARVNKGLTQKEAANLLNVSNKTLCMWEKNASLPKADKIDAICELYGVQYDDVIFFSKDNA